MYKKISEYGIIGNLKTVALIGLDGAVDWFCFPHIDSPSVFGALLDDDIGGRFVVQPIEPFDSVAEYRPGTNILVTRFRTRSGVIRLTDFMNVSFGVEEEQEEVRLHFYRLIEGQSGTVPVRMLFEPRFEYGALEPRLERIDGGVLARAGQWSMALTCDRKIAHERVLATGVWEIAAGDTVWLRLGSKSGKHEQGSHCSREEISCVTRSEGRDALQKTEQYWQDWLFRSETGRSFDYGPYREMIERSALVLKLLYYSPSGTIAAAATTSLPEEIGGVRNWDYRYTWLRDTAFTLQALFNMGHLSETEGYLHWIERLLSEHGSENLQIMYGLRGETNLPEYELSHLDGHKGSRPVRIGNGAAGQKQLDIYGELMEAALKLSDYVGKIDAQLWPALRSICDHVVEHWHEPDFGIWEVRGGPYHFVYSKVMCWVALDRGLTISERYGFPADRETWKKTMERIRREVLGKGLHKEKKAFVQHYGTDALDASTLLIPMLGFLPFDDERVVATVEAIQQELSHDGFLYRYLSDDGLAGGEGVFLLCSFWLVDCLIGMGRVEEGELLLQRLHQAANHLGLFSEEYDPVWKEHLGNFPQAFTHIGFVNSVMALMQKRREQAAELEREAAHTGLMEFVQKKIFATRVVLNQGEPDEEEARHGLGGDLKRTMNMLRGAFFLEERVAYEQMKRSELYAHFVDLSVDLQLFDLDRLRSREEKTAFWINMYNVIVIHGVVELGIRDSVKEVRKFFSRVCYEIGRLEFTPEDIEHGILRANRKPPHALSRVFHGNDPRLRHSLERVDPRIHFALVCASSSCPPIGVYTEEGLDRELDVAARTFVNGGGVKLDRDEGRVLMSRIFSWYGEDFGADQEERIRFAAQYLYVEEDRNYLEEHAGVLNVEFQDYDWRLNRD
ncbi:MAG: glycoside hydrolase family 15 protein [Desulfovibrionales bacterium]